MAWGTTLPCLFCPLFLFFLSLFCLDCSITLQQRRCLILLHAPCREEGPGALKAPPAGTRTRGLSGEAGSTRTVRLFTDAMFTDAH